MRNALCYRNPRTLRFAGVVAFFVQMIMFAVAAQAQQGASPLELGRQEVPDLLGATLGPAFTKQMGWYDVGCPCAFDGGAGGGFAIGLSYDKNMTTYGGSGAKGGLWFGIRGLFETRALSALFREFEIAKVQSLAVREQWFSVPIEFRQRADLNFTLFTLTPYFSWYPFGRAFLQGGLQAGFVSSTRLTHKKELLQDKVTLPNGEVATVQFAKVEGTEILIEEGNAQRVNSFQLGLSLGVGIDIPVGSSENPRFRLTPMLNQVIPLSVLAERVSNPDPEGAGLRILTTQILIALKMNLR